jgi:hypothetical protein
MKGDVLHTARCIAFGDRRHGNNDSDNRSRTTDRQTDRHTVHMKSCGKSETRCRLWKLV